jgi:hypothetical protein
MDPLYDMTGCHECTAWLQERGIDPTAATPAQCIEALNATGVLVDGGPVATYTQYTLHYCDTPCEHIDCAHNKDTPTL